ncbi:hypothetical protein SAMN03159290_04959 [Pseudomonas sp. NFACC13-1]|nr:hypothetical protein SAMN03159290_04959 [Pseudomonas sp. NFACC13-1]
MKPLGLMQNLWRGDLSPLGCVATPVLGTAVQLMNHASRFTTAAQPSGDKSPRHRRSARLENSCTYNGKCRLNNARNAAGFTGLAR